VIDAQAITYIDSVGLTIIEEVLKYFHNKGIPVCFANLTGRAEMALVRAGLIDRIVRTNLFPRLHDAIRAYLAHDISIPYIAEVISPEPSPEAKSSFSIFGKIRQNWNSGSQKQETDISPDPDEILTNLEEEEKSTGTSNPLYSTESGTKDTKTKTKKSPPMFLVGTFSNQENQEHQEHKESSSDSSSDEVPFDPDQTSSSSS